MHSPVRFTLMAALAIVDDASYQVLKKELDVSYALLSKHAAILEEQGLIELKKSFLGKKPKLSSGLPGRAGKHFKTMWLRWRTS